jgi:hypothetical protein
MGELFATTYRHSALPYLFLQAHVHNVHWIIAFDNEKAANIGRRDRRKLFFKKFSLMDDAIMLRVSYAMDFIMAFFLREYCKWFALSTCWKHRNCNRMPSMVDGSLCRGDDNVRWDRNWSKARQKTKCNFHIF